MKGTLEVRKISWVSGLNTADTKGWYSQIPRECEFPSKRPREQRRVRYESVTRPILLMLKILASKHTTPLSIQPEFLTTV